MPVTGFQYNARPYSSFRASRVSCGIHQPRTSCNNTNYQPSTTPLNSCSKTLINKSSHNNNNHHIPAVGHSLQTSASSSSLGSRINNNNNSINHSNNNSTGTSAQFQRQQPFRSSYYGTRYNFKTADNTQITYSAANNTTNTAITVKPLTPKLVRRIESTCIHHTKPKAPAPPVTTSSGKCSTPPTAANKQYLRTRNQQQQQPPTPPLRKSSHFDRFHQANLSIRQKTNINGPSYGNNSCASFTTSTNDPQDSQVLQKQLQRSCAAVAVTQKRAYTNAVSSKVTKENQPKTAENNGSHINGPIKSIKSYPAPLPPQGTPKALTRRKCKEDARLNSVSASPNLNNRRFISSVGINSFNASCNSKATPLYKRKPYVHSTVTHQNIVNCAVSSPLMSAKTGSNCSNSSSNQSSASQGSPKSKKAFSKKFPQGLPFEDEFYRQHRSYSHSSSSNYSFYSTNGARVNAAAHTPHDYKRPALEDDEFQRKPSTEDSLYVDFSKVMQRNDSKSSNHTTFLKSYENPTSNKLHPPTAWLRMNSPPPSPDCKRTTNFDTSHDSPHSPRRHYNATQSQYLPPTPPTIRTFDYAPLPSRTKYSQSINDYLYTSNGGKLCVTTSPQKNTSDSRKSLLYKNSKLSSYLDPSQNADNGYYTHASPESSPPSITTTSSTTASAVSSWAPKCSHPTKVLIPASSNSSTHDGNNNWDYRQNHNTKYSPKEDYYERLKQYNSGSKLSTSNAGKSEDILELTNSEYR